MYVTGGVGDADEYFEVQPYVLRQCLINPQKTYDNISETCAGTAMMFWGMRMAAITGAVVSSIPSSELVQ